MAEYLWQEGEYELQRLRALEALYDPGTVRLLDDVGVADGWRCAEVGAGAGSIVEWLSRHVGSKGHVVAQDIDARFLEAVARPNVEVRATDIVDQPLERGTYDLIHARAVLEHLPNREDVVTSLVAALRDGGILLAEDIVLSAGNAAFPPSGLVGRVNEAFAKGLAMTGADPDFGLRLPSVLTDAGLVDVHADGRVPIVTSGTPSADFHTLSLRQLGALFVDAGLLSEEDVREGLDALNTSGLTMLAPTMVAAWGRMSQRSPIE